MRQDAVEYVGVVEAGVIINLPVYAFKVPAGFPSPADDYLECRIDLNEELIDHPHSTFILNVSGDSMIGAGIIPGGKLIVDKVSLISLRRVFFFQNIFHLRTSNDYRHRIKDHLFR